MRSVAFALVALLAGCVLGPAAQPMPWPAHAEAPIEEPYPRGRMPYEDKDEEIQARAVTCEETRLPPRGDLAPAEAVARARAFWAGQKDAPPEDALAATGDRYLRSDGALFQRDGGMCGPITGGYGIPFDGRAHHAVTVSLWVDDGSETVWVALLDSSTRAVLAAAVAM